MDDQNTQHQTTVVEDKRDSGRTGRNTYGDQGAAASASWETRHLFPDSGVTRFVDEYCHEDARLFYTEENCPGRGCDRDLLSAQLAGCRCRERCGPRCPCGGADVGPCGGAAVAAAVTGGATDQDLPARECNSDCLCSADCRLRVVQRGPLGGLVVTAAGARGLGLRTARAIAAGQFVCCYAGEVIGVGEAARRFAAQHAHNYILAVREHCAGRLTVTYIDATRVCNIGHYINHSCQPNLALRPVRVETPVPHAALFTVRDIAAGEELTFSYGAVSGPGDGGRPCLCGQAQCRGRMPSERLLEDEERPYMLPPQVCLVNRRAQLLVAQWTAWWMRRGNTAGTRPRQLVTVRNVGN